MSDDDELPADQLAGLDLGSLMEQAQSMMHQAQAVGDTVVEGSAGGGAVTIRVTGMGRFEGVSIARAAVDPDDVESLEDLVLAALRDCNARIAELQAGSLDDLDLGSMGGLLGGLGGGRVIDTDAEE